LEQPGGINSNPSRAKNTARNAPTPTIIQNANGCSDLAMGTGRPAAPTKMLYVHMRAKKAEPKRVLALQWNREGIKDHDA
jgi:hypothetical protein